MDFKAIYDEAVEAAKAAVAAEAPEDPRAFDCGFAWVTIRPARGGFVSWCKMQNEDAKYTREFGYIAHGGGWQFWCPASRAGFSGQSIRIHKAAAKAFASVLTRQGLDVSVDSRLD